MLAESLNKEVINISTIFFAKFSRKWYCHKYHFDVLNYELTTGFTAYWSCLAWLFKISNNNKIKPQIVGFMESA